MLRLLALFVGLSMVAAGAPTVVRVAPNGDDKADGVRAPVATLARARDAVRALRQAGELPEGAEIVVAPGNYDLLEPVVFGPEDAGTKAAPLVVRAAGKEKPVLRGGPTLRDFSPYQGKIQKCDLKALGLEGRAFNQLFFRGQRMPLARTPNLDPEDVHGGIWAHALGGDNSKPKRAFRYGEDIDPTNWQHPEDASVGIFCRYDWRWNWKRVKSVDLKRKMIEFTSDTTYEVYIGDRYFVKGVFEELDDPGEWYLDRRTWTVYFWPPKPIRQGDVSVAVSPSLIRLEKTAFVTVRGFVLEGCTSTGVGFAGATDCRVEACEIRGTGAWGARMDGGQRNTVFGCDVHHVGQGGIYVGGGDRKTLARGDNRAENNVIHHNGVFQKTYNTGINLTGVGNFATHNLVYDTPHAGLVLSGNDNLLEYNTIHHTNLQSTDTGGVYSCPRDWTARGNTIRYNIWHDIGGFGKRSSWVPVQNGLVHFEYPHFTWAIYMDDPTSGNTIFGNILYRVPISGMHNHGGRDNAFDNNIIVDCPAFQAGRLAPNWSNWPRIKKLLHDYTKPGSPYLDHYPRLREYRDERPEAMTGLSFRRNIVYYTKDGTAWLRKHRSWGDRMLLYTYRIDQQDMATNTFDQNLVYCEPGLEPFVKLTAIPEKAQELSWEEWQKTGADKGSQLGDPRFVDAANLDFRLKPNSPALKLGFQPIPVAKIGPYADAQRASWPVVEQSTAAGKVKPTVRAYDLYPQIKAQRLAVRGGLPRTMAKLKAGEKVRIVYFGGGIHGSTGWRKLYLDSLRKTYPEATIEEIHAGICDCVRGSGYNHWRYEHDVLAKQPDLVLVDFGSDDHVTTPPAIQCAIEGVIRKTRRANPAPELLFFHAFRAGFEKAYATGKCPTAITAYELLADHYGIPSVNAGYDIAQEVRAGTLVVKGDKKAFSADGTRPSALANQCYAATLAAAFTELATAKAAEPAALPEPLAPDHLEHAHEISATKDMLSGEWTRRGPEDPLMARYARHFDELWVTRQPGAKLTYSFTGTGTGLALLVGPDIGRYRVSVDGKERSTQSRVDRWCYYHRLSAGSVASNLPFGKHTVQIELLPDPPNRDDPIAEAKRLDKYKAEDFQGVALMIGKIRVVTPPGE
ncbi:MAG: hypothetical protein HN849_30505 [Victivallales bacterium]|nr:hypothetical protein [Victivallales bacterium]